MRQKRHCEAFKLICHWKHSTDKWWQTANLAQYLIAGCCNMANWMARSQPLAVKMSRRQLKVLP